MFVGNSSKNDKREEFDMKNGYAIGSPNEKGGYGIWFMSGLTDCISQKGKKDGDVIFHSYDKEMIPYYKWDGSKWVSIELAKIKDNLIRNIINTLKVLNYQLKSKSHDDLILFFTHKDWKYGVSIGVRVIGIDFIDNEEHDVRMAFTFSHSIINVSTKEFRWNDKMKFSEYEKEILGVKRLIENRKEESKRIITLH